MKKQVIKYIITGIILLAFGISESIAQVVVVKKRVPPRGRTVVHVANPVKIIHRGVTLHYSRGVFYRPIHGGRFVVVSPPVGIRLRTLPPAYTRVVIRGSVFFYYNGVYYRSVSNSDEFEVVSPPVGAKVSDLPDGYELKVIDGVQYYVVDDTFYKKTLNNEKEARYEVVEGPVVSKPEVVIGARYPHLPSDAELRVIDGKKFYQSNEIFFKDIVVADTIWYEIVGTN